MYGNLSSYWLAHFYLIKKSAEELHRPSSQPYWVTWVTPNRSLNMKCMVPAFLETGLAGKKVGCKSISRPPKN
jgi:hypothetical protein